VHFNKASLPNLFQILEVMGRIAVINEKREYKLSRSVSLLLFLVSKETLWNHLWYQVRGSLFVKITGNHAHRHWSLKMRELKFSVRVVLCMMAYT